MFIFNFEGHRAEFYTGTHRAKRAAVTVEIETLLQLNLWNLGLVWFIVTFHGAAFQ